ncbi:MAG: hypothetical protein AB7H92_14680 [Microbacteriaceae bacterium]
MVWWTSAPWQRSEDRSKNGPRPTKPRRRSGRAEGKAAREFLSALRDHKPKRGRKRAAESIDERRIAVIDEALVDADTIAKLKLTQQRMVLESELAWLEEPAVDLDALEEAFVEVAASYSERSGISDAAWRQVGAAPSVLSRAGISRSA